MYFKVAYKTAVIIVLLLLPFCLQAQTSADKDKVVSKLNAILSGKNNIAVHVYDLDEGADLYNRNSEQPLKPASTLKILTSITALNELGPEYIFNTQFLVSNSADGAATIYVKGKGDPYLTTEFLWIAARKVKKLGITKVRQIVIDDKAFLNPPSRQGQRSYMTGASAMSFNFNSIVIEVCPSKPGQPAIISTDPWEAPVTLVNSAKTAAKGLTSLSADEAASNNKAMHKFAVKGNINYQDSCKIINRSIAEPASYFASTFESFLRYLGIKVEKPFSFAPFPGSEGMLFAQPTYPLSYVIKGLNHYSTNFIAEQILYRLGADTDNEFYSRETGIQKLEAMINQLGFSKNEYAIYDGSGLSHDNKISARILTKLLEFAYQNPRIKSEFIASLPIAGVSGTLRKRNFDTSNAIVRGKTGSLDGVSTLAGYVFTAGGKNLAFTILQNNISSKDSAVTLEEKITDILSSAY